MNHGREFSLRSSNVISMEPEVRTQLLQNKPCRVSKPCRFQGTQTESQEKATANSSEVLCLLGGPHLEFTGAVLQRFFVVRDLGFSFALNEHCNSIATKAFY